MSKEERSRVRAERCRARRALIKQSPELRAAENAKLRARRREKRIAAGLPAEYVRPKKYATDEERIAAEKETFRRAAKRRQADPVKRARDLEVRRRSRRIANMTPERREKVAEATRRRRRVANMKPEVVERRNAKRREMYDPSKPENAERIERHRIRHREYMRKRRETEDPIEARKAAAIRRRARAEQASRATADQTGSVLIAAAPSPWQNILSEITRLAPRSDYRDDIVAEAALKVVEGATIADALAMARRSVNRENGRMRYMKPIEDCFWL